VGINGDQNPSGGREDRTRKLQAVIVGGTLVLVLSTTWVGLSLSGVFGHFPPWVSYTILGADLIALAVVWRLLTSRAM
jgi:hypothetical protein